MSAVTLLCADRPLPLYDSGIRRVETSSHGGHTVSIETNGFSVQEHTYYREAVEDLGLELKPYQYELDPPGKENAMPSNRIGRINEEIQRELAALIRTVKDPRVHGLVSITAVDTTSDLRYAKIYVSVLDKSDVGEVVKGLKSAGGYLRRELGRALQLRYTPELQFVEDDSIGTGAHILSMLRDPEVVKPANPANEHIRLEDEE